MLREACHHVCWVVSRALDRIDQCARYEDVMNIPRLSREYSLLLNLTRCRKVKILYVVDPSKIGVRQ